MDFFDITALAGGLALFLYGMNVMSTSLEKASGGKMEQILQRLTGRLWKSVLFGILITATIQSSSATTVIVVGLVNSGILNLNSAIGVIMGANIGTTVTSQLLSLGDISSDEFLLLLLKPKNLAPIIAVVGILMIMLSKKSSKKNFGNILIGFGILFTGMYAMESAVSPLASSPIFSELFATLSNPVLGILVGALVTALIQSSSASVGILQALSSTGQITYSAAIPIIMGQNIGTCITALISSIGANKNAKRAAMVHLYFNLIGTTIFIAAVYAFQYLVGFDFWTSAIDRSGIANFHLIFNIVVTLGFLPFTKFLEKLALATIKDKETEEEKNREIVLDPRLLTSPSIAIQQAKTAVTKMGYLAKYNYDMAIKCLHKYDSKAIARIRENEDVIDRMEGAMGKYLLQLTDKELTDNENRAVSALLHMVTDFERIGDYAMNVVERAEEMKDKNIIFSDKAYDELRIIGDAISEVISYTNEAFEFHDVSKATKVEPIEETVDLMKDLLKNRHIERLKAGLCNVDSGIIFLEILTNLERISDHCSNIAVYIIASSKEESIDSHEYLKNVHAGAEANYNSLLEHYETKYLKEL